MPIHDPYGSEHRRRRVVALAQAFNTPCSRCGLLMLKGQDLDFAHSTEDVAFNRTGKADEMQHSSCNRSDGARLGAKLRDLAPSRKW